MMERLKTYNYLINLLVDLLDDDDAVHEVVEDQLKRNGVINYRLFTEVDPFLAGLNAKPHICLIDYRLDGALNGLNITEIVLKQNPHCEVIMITAMDGWEGYRVMKAFHRIEGEGRKWWVDKNEDDWQNQLVISLQQAIGHIKQKLELRERLESLEGSVIRKNRTPLSSETTNDN